MNKKLSILMAGAILTSSISPIMAEEINNRGYVDNSLAGEDRYETAVKIAEEYAGLTGNNVSSSTGEINIVLVNGNSLVDGLAASPLAASLSEENGYKAPILLTRADSLPKSTSSYLKRVLRNVTFGNINKVTIHLVGGESVLTKSLERELKGLGFSTERYDGENREETSLAVAEKIEKLNKITSNNIGDAFVVGAEGEADAMSIAAVASKIKTPIIVSKKGGISEDAVENLAKKDVVVVGGKNVFTNDEFTDLKIEAKSVMRIAGSNRKDTNAMIISKYYKDEFVGAAKSVIIAKDGQNNKNDLIDALAAANMAAEKNAPILLATDSLSKEQINALEMNAKESYGLFRIGHGISRDVIKTVARCLGLTNR